MPIDQNLVDKIYELVGEGVISVLEMERHLNIFVKKQLFSNQPSPSVGNRRFYPSRTDIRNHMYRAVVRFRHSKIDQENLESKIMEWKAEVPDDNFFFRTYVKEADEIPNPTPYDANEDEVKMTSSSYESHTNLLFVHQSKWQRDILQKLSYILLSLLLYVHMNSDVKL